MSETWAIGAVPLRCNWQGVEQTIEVAGWLKGAFGLDFRVFDDAEGDFVSPGFVLTHVPSGYVVRQIIAGSIVDAQKLADEIMAGADWSFVDKPGPEHGALIKRLMLEHPGEIAFGHHYIGPRP